MGKHCTHTASTNVTSSTQSTEAQTGVVTAVTAHSTSGTPPRAEFVRELLKQQDDLQELIEEIESTVKLRGVGWEDGAVQWAVTCLSPKMLGEGGECSPGISA